MDKKNILLTGHTGFLGNILHKVLVANGFTVSPMIDAKGQKIDLTENFFYDIPSNIILHAAGKAHAVPRTPEQEKLFYQVNLEGTKNLCAAIDQLTLKPTAFLFISTVAVYGLDSGEFIKESHALNGTTPYARSKIMAEEWLKGWAEERGIKLGILRLPLVAGPHPPGNLGAMINGIRSGRYLSIGQASARKSMVWAADMATIMPQLAKIGGIYNLTDGYHPSFGELEKGLAGALMKKQPFKVPMAVAGLLGYAGDILGSRFPVNTDKINKITSTLTFDDSKARERLGWKPSQVLDKVGEMVSS